MEIMQGTIRIKVKTTKNLKIKNLKIERIQKGGCRKEVIFKTGREKRVT